MLGMTAYSFNEVYLDELYLSTEIKSVNHRFLDINVHLQQFISPLEINIRELVSSTINRGKIDINVYLRMKNYVTDIVPNLDLAKKYYESINKIKSNLKLKGKITISDMLKYDDILIMENNHNLTKIWELIKKSLEKNINEVIAMKKNEGESTHRNIVELLNEIENSIFDIEKYLPLLEETIFKNLKSKIVELVGDRIDNERLVQEAGILVSKSCVNEEINRLKHHISHFRKIMKEDIDVGKKLDFLCQEMHREINTLGNKATLGEISILVINVKNYIEKIREQLRNIE